MRNLGKMSSLFSRPCQILLMIMLANHCATFSLDLLQWKIVANDLLQAYQTGEKQFLIICEDRFNSEEVGFFDSLPSQKLKTFSVMNKVKSM